MARPREFDTEDALESAMQVFWQRGYQDASLPDLLEGMGLTRGSLYKAFQDKKNLFLMVLDRYEGAQVDTGVRLLRNTECGDGRDRIRAFFGTVVAAVDAGDHRGCLLCTATSGAAVNDADIAQVVYRGLAKMQQGFAYALADVEGISAAQHLPLANTLLTQYIGLRMLSRSRLPLGVLEQSVEGIANMIDGAVARDAGL